jgi:hypothetical protein
MSKLSLRTATPVGPSDFTVEVGSLFKHEQLSALLHTLVDSNVMDLALTYESGLSHVYSRDWNGTAYGPWEYRLVYAP